jgi:hypothetical protein
MEKYDFYKRTNLKSSASKDLLNQSISNEKVSDEKVLNDNVSNEIMTNEVITNKNISNQEQIKQKVKIDFKVLIDYNQDNTKVNKVKLEIIDFFK